MKNYLKQTDTNGIASVFSMNCFGGHIYQDLSWQYTSPTAGLFFYAEDFVKLASNIELIKRPIIFKEVSKWEDANEKMRTRQYVYPIGLISDTDIEVHFLHYHTKEEAKKKWEKRVSRFNFDNYILIGFQQNLCTKKIIDDFCKIPHKNKVWFSNIPNNNKSVIYIPEFRKLPNSPDPYKYVSVYYRYLAKWIKN